MTKGRNVFEQLEGVDTKDEPQKKPEGKWGIGTKITPTSEQKEETKKEVTHIEPPKEEKKDHKWSMGTKKIEQVKPPEQPKQVFVPPPA